MKTISSIQNPLVKHLLLLQEKSRARRQSGEFVCEGLNEIRLCLQGGYELVALCVVPEIVSLNELEQHLELQVPDEKLIALSAEVFDKVAYRDGVRNAIALLKQKTHDLKDLPEFENPLFLVAEKVEKPGNLGALLRTADAAGIAAVLLADPLCDLYNPNVVRGSVGCAFTVPVAMASTADIHQFLKHQNASVFTTFMEAAVPVWQADFKQPAAIVVGTESTGLSDAWRQPGFVNITMPMFGLVDSMNVSVASALLMYEAVRQRHS